MKKELRAEDLAYHSRLRQELLKINTEHLDKAIALKEAMWSQKEGSKDRVQHKAYEWEYGQKLEKLKVETWYAKYNARKELNGERLVNQGKIRRSYEDEEPERFDEAGTRG